MASIRQEKISTLIKQELSKIFQQEALILCKGAMVSVTVVRVTPDMGLAKVYLSIFGHKDNNEVFDNIQDHNKQIRHTLSQIVKNQIRRTPELAFYLDDSYDYARKIDDLLKK